LSRSTNGSIGINGLKFELIMANYWALTNMYIADGAFGHNKEYCMSHYKSLYLQEWHEVRKGEDPGEFNLGKGEGNKIDLSFRCKSHRGILSGCTFVFKKLL
jgi:hypothetical protein